MVLNNYSITYCSFALNLVLNCYPAVIIYSVVVRLGWQFGISLVAQRWHSCGILAAQCRQNIAKPLTGYRCIFC